MMENVYVIKVKTKPPLSSLYPSERRYSASTVGGLSFVHFGLGALSLLLGTLALSLQGPILSIACLVPSVTGLLAWRRWYIDRNIAIFFYGSLFSLIAAILCFVVTVFDIAAATDAAGGSLWSLEKILEHPRGRSSLEIGSRNETSIDDGKELGESFNISEDYSRTLVNGFEAPTPGIVIDKMSNISGYILRNAGNTEEEVARDGGGTFSGNDLKEEASLIYERKIALSGESTELDSNNGTEESLEMIKSKVVSFWQKNYHDTSQAKILLTVNVLVASLLEVFWSALSAKIALRGMMNRLPDTSYANNTADSGKPEEPPIAKRKPPAPRPDILDHDRRLSESLQNLTTLHTLRSSGPRLPLPESSREFRERVERFLANQAAHRIVEGSCA